MARKSAKEYNNNALDGRNGRRRDNGGGDGIIRDRGTGVKAIGGKLSVNLKGFGFVAPENGGTDIFAEP